MPAELLEVDDLVCTFGEFRALAGVSVHVPEGRWHGLIGPNGAGKSTFFNVLTGVARARSGSVRLKGQPILGRSPDKVARTGIARTFQTVRVFAGRTIAEHVRVAAEASPRGDAGSARDALEAVGLRDAGDLVADGLPHAARKRLSIAMCLATRPALLLLDEPTAGLDDGETRDFGEMLRSVHDRYGLTSILVEHKLSFVMGLSDAVTVLDYGEVIAEGPPTRIASDPKVIEAYLGKAEDDA